MAAKLSVHGKLELSNGDVMELPFTATFADDEEAIDQYWAVVKGAFGESEKQERADRGKRHGNVTKARK